MPERPPQTPNPRKNSAEVVISPFFSHGHHSKDVYGTPSRHGEPGAAQVTAEYQTGRAKPRTPSPRKRKRAEVTTSPYFSSVNSFNDTVPPSGADGRGTKSTLDASYTSSQSHLPQTPSPRKKKKVDVWISPYFEHSNPPRNARILPRRPALPQQTASPAPHSRPPQLEEHVEDPACTKLYDELQPLKPLLVQEKVAGDKWKLLVACIMLNVTSGKQALPVFWEMMERWPTPFSMSQANKADLVALLSHLGLQDVRAERLIAMSFEYLKDPPKDYDPRLSRVSIPRKGAGQTTPRKRDKRAEPSYPDTPVSHLPGSGRYALDSYRIFCTVHDDPLSTEWKSVLPTDKELIRYLKWKWAVREHKQWSPSQGPGAPATTEYLANLKLELLPPDTGNIRRKSAKKSPRKKRSSAPHCSDSDSW